MNALLVESAAVTHVGLVRRANQDAFALGDVIVAAADECSRTVPRAPLARAALYAVVADGMGGAPCGERASEIAVRTVVERWPVDAIGALEALAVADAALYAEMERDVAARRMGTTIAGVIVGPFGLDAFGVGDCFIAQLSGSLVRPLLRTAAAIAESTVVDAALGGNATPKPLKVDRMHVDDPTGRYLIASDGLLRDLSWNELRPSLLLAALTPAQHVAEILTRVLAAGASDNITCAIVEVTHAD